MLRTTTLLLVAARAAAQPTSTVQVESATVQVESGGVLRIYSGGTLNIGVPVDGAVALPTPSSAPPSTPLRYCDVACDGVGSGTLGPWTQATWQASGQTTGYAYRTPCTTPCNSTMCGRYYEMAVPPGSTAAQVAGRSTNLYRKPGSGINATDMYLQPVQQYDEPTQAWSAPSSTAGPPYWLLAQQAVGTWRYDGYVTLPDSWSTGNYSGGLMGVADYSYNFDPAWGVQAMAITDNAGCSLSAPAAGWDAQACSGQLGCLQPCGWYMAAYGDPLPFDRISCVGDATPAAAASPPPLPATPAIG